MIIVIDDGEKKPYSFCGEYFKFYHQPAEYSLNIDNILWIKKIHLPELSYEYKKNPLHKSFWDPHPSKAFVGKIERYVDVLLVKVDDKIFCIDDKKYDWLDDVKLLRD